MTVERIMDPDGFLYELGHLHDVCVGTVEFDTANDTLRLTLDDINAAVDSETSKHQNRRPCALIFRGVGRFLFDVETNEGIRIGHAAIVADRSRLLLEVDLNLGGGNTTEGRHSIVVSFESLHISDIEAP